MTTQYYMVHKQDAEWMIGEQVSACKHAFQMSGYELADLVEIAAQRGSVIVKAEGSIFDSSEKIIQRVI